MITRREVRLLVTVSIVLGAHLIVVWFLVSSPQLLVKTKSESLQLVWIQRPALSESSPERVTTTRGLQNMPPAHRVDRSSALPPMTPLPKEKDNATHPAPDWAEELKLAAEHAVANELAQKRHEKDFAHAFPAPPTKLPQFAWDYAATHRVEAIPGGGMLVHLGDNCVLILPLPFIACGIGKRPANGDLFGHRGDH
jgi:hypothetical protein